LIFLPNGREISEIHADGHENIHPARNQSRFCCWSRMFLLGCVCASDPFMNGCRNVAYLDALDLTNLLGTLLCIRVCQSDMSCRRTDPFIFSKSGLIGIGHGSRKRDRFSRISCQLAQAMESFDVGESSKNRKECSKAIALSFPGTDFDQFGSHKNRFRDYSNLTVRHPF
jgi:hypothetical protein